MQRLFEEARSQYDKARQTYAAYADANQEVTLQAYKMKADDLENDMQLKYNIYTQVVEQLQLAKAKVQERTPAFTVIESAAVPLRASSKSRASMVITYLFFGFFIHIYLLSSVYPLITESIIFTHLSMMICLSLSRSLDSHLSENFFHAFSTLSLP